MCGCGCELALALAKTAAAKAALQDNGTPRTATPGAVTGQQRSELGDPMAGAWFAAAWRRYLVTAYAERDALHAGVTQSVP